MKPILKKPLIFAALALSSASSCAQGAPRSKEWKVYQARISAILQGATARIREGDDAENTRFILLRAMAKNGDYAPAKALIGTLTRPDRRARGWSLVGRAQGKLSEDRAGATASFKLATEEVARIETGQYDRNVELRSIALAQAQSGDVEGALRVIEGVSQFEKFSALEGVARVAARAGNLKPAQSLLQIATSPDEISQANGLISIGLATGSISIDFVTEQISVKSASISSLDAAQAALSKVTLPQHKIPVLLAMCENLEMVRLLEDPTLKKDYLSQALALVPQVKGEGAFDRSNIIRDAFRGAIAYWQLRLSEEKASGAEAVKILEAVEDGASAQKWIELSSALLANSHLEEARAIADRPALSPIVRIDALCAITRVLGEKWVNAREKDKPALNKQVSDTINASIKVLNTMDGSDRSWALASIARATARAYDFTTARKLADMIQTPRIKSYALAGVALAGMEQDNAPRATSALEAMEAAAREEANPNDAAHITAQSVLAILDPLLDDEEVGFSEAAAGLH